VTAEPGSNHWALTLYISGASPHSMCAIENARRLSDIRRVRQSLELGPPESIDEYATPGG
jgi:hypothetical protein